MYSDRLRDAMLFAYYAHLGQFRKCSPEKSNLYVSHPLSVMGLVKKFGGTEEDMVIACLHDVIEDCADKGFNYDVIKSKFGKKIADRVQDLTNDKRDPNTGRELSEEEWKARKKEIQIYKAKRMSSGNQLVKACDQLHNMSDYKEYDKNNIVYRGEYLQKAYDVIRVCSSVPLELKVYARSLYNEAREFFVENKNIPYKDVPKFIKAQKFNIPKPEQVYAMN